MFELLLGGKYMKNKNYIQDFGCENEDVVMLLCINIQE